MSTFLVACIVSFVEILIGRTLAASSELMTVMKLHLVALFFAFILFHVIYFIAVVEWYNP